MRKKEVRSIQQWFEFVIREHADKILLSEHRGYRTYSLTGKELEEQVQQTRTFLHEVKLRTGDKVILLGRNSLEWVIVYFSCILSGLIVVPLDPTTTRALLQRIQKQVQAKMLFLDREMASLRITKYYFDQLPQRREKTIRRSLPLPSIKPHHILQIVYTSGTTGMPKGVILTHGNMTSAVKAAIQGIPLRLRLRMLQLLPLSHIFAQVPGLLLMLYQGHHLFFTDQLLPSKLISFIRNKRIHGVILVPGILGALRTTLEGKSVWWHCGIQFRLIGIGGAPLDIKLQNWWKRRGIMVVPGYGLTETAAMVTANPLWGGPAGSAGKVVPGVEVRLASDGEILVRGKNVTSGYYRDKEKTRQALAQGWLKTGDLGEWKKGYLYIKERKKDLIVTSGGLNVYPVDIEQVLNRMKEVQESCVLEYRGKIHAVLILTRKTSLPELIRRANRELQPPQQIQSYSLWPARSFPKTPTGKIKKYLVQEHLVPEHLVQEQVRQPVQYKYENPFWALLHEVLQPTQKITATKRLADLGMDSLKRVEFLAAVERELAVEVEENRITSRTRVQDLETLLRKQAQSRKRFPSWCAAPLAKAVRVLGQFLLVYPLISLFSRTEYTGLENFPLKNIPRGQPVILAANHQSAWDAPLLLRKIKTPVAIAAADDYVFGLGVKNFWLRQYRRGTGFLAALFFKAYPFGEQIGTTTSLEFTGEWLDRGHSILIFPEGERTRDGKIQSFKPGVGYLAVQMKVPVIPLKIEGLFDVLPYSKIIPHWGKCTLKIGKPILLQETSYLQATKLIERKVKEL